MSVTMVVSVLWTSATPPRYLFIAKLVQWDRTRVVVFLPSLSRQFYLFPRDNASRDVVTGWMLRKYQRAVCVAMPSVMCKSVPRGIRFAKTLSPLATFWVCKFRFYYSCLSFVKLQGKNEVTKQTPTVKRAIKFSGPSWMRSLLVSLWTVAINLPAFTYRLNLTQNFCN